MEENELNPEQRKQWYIFSDNWIGANRLVDTLTSNQVVSNEDFKPVTVQEMQDCWAAFLQTLTTQNK